MTTWILVSSASEAKLYQTKNLRTEPLEQINTFSHDESREKGSDLVSDHPGRYSTPGGSARGSYEKNDPKEHEAEVFAAILAKHLNKAHAEQHFNRLIIVALPHFHGEVKKHLKFKDIPISHIEKNYVKLNMDQLTERLKEVGV